MAYLDDILTLSPLALWKLDETSGVIAQDSTLNNYDGAYVGSGYTLGNRLGPDGGYYVDFSGTGGYINAFSSGLAGVFDGREGTLAGWIKVDTFANGDHILLFYTSAQNYVRLEIRASALKFYYMAANVNLNNEISIPQAEWIHIAITWSDTGDYAKAYINGELVWYVTGIGSWNGALTVARLATQATTDFLDGSLAYWGVWNTPLSKSNIKNILFGGVINPASSAPGTSFWNNLRSQFPVPTTEDVWLKQTDSNTYDIYVKIHDGTNPWWVRYHMIRVSGSALFEAGGALVQPIPANETPNNWTGGIEKTFGQTGAVSSGEIGLSVGLTMTGAKSFIGANHGYETLTSESWTVDGEPASFLGGWDHGIEIIYTADTDLQHPSSGGADVGRRQWTLTINKNLGYFKYNILLSWITTVWVSLYVDQLNYYNVTNFTRGRLLEDGPDYDITDAIIDGHERSKTWLIHNPSDYIFIAGYIPNSPNDFILGRAGVSPWYTTFGVDDKVRPLTIFSSYGICYINGENITAFDCYYEFFGGHIFINDFGNQTHDLTAIDILSGIPVLDTPIIAQTHDLTAIDILSGIPVLDTPVIAQTHYLTAIDILSGIPVLDTPIIWSNIPEPTPLSRIYKIFKEDRTIKIDLEDRTIIITK